MVLYCEFKLFIFDFIASVRKNGGLKPISLEKRIEYLSSLIKKVPYWTRGHLLYAEAYTKLDISNSSDYARSRSAIRVSATAVLSLIKKKPNEEYRSRARYFIELLSSSTTESPLR